jgi:VanZ family protein
MTILGRLPRWLRDFAPLVIWMVLIFALSHRSVLVVIENDAGEKTFYKSAHMVAYAMLMWLWWRALSPQREARWLLLLPALGLTILYGISDEIHQLFVPGRYGRIADVLFDTGGALLMLLLLRQLKWLRTVPERLI